MVHSLFKQFVVCIGKHAWWCESAVLRLSDLVESDEFNYPTICMNFVPLTDDTPGPVEVVAMFERHVAKDGDAAMGLMDTCRPWSRTYDGIVVLSPTTAFHIADGKFALTLDDELRVNVGRHIADAIRLFNSAKVHRDECLQLMHTLARFQARLSVVYETSDGPVPLGTVPNRFANAQRLSTPAAATKGEAKAQTSKEQVPGKGAAVRLDGLAEILGALARSEHDPLCKAVCESFESALSCLADGDDPASVIRGLASCLDGDFAAEALRKQPTPSAAVGNGRAYD